jgi:hypothetical protein
MTGGPCHSMTPSDRKLGCTITQLRSKLPAMLGRAGRWLEPRGGQVKACQEAYRRRAAESTRGAM